LEFLFIFIMFLCQVLTLAIILRAIISRFPPSPPNKLVNIPGKITGSVLSPLRRIIPRVGMPDITPLVAIVLLQLISRLLPLIRVSNTQVADLRGYLLEPIRQLYFRDIL